MTYLPPTKLPSDFPRYQDSNRRLRLLPHLTSPLQPPFLRPCLPANPIRLSSPGHPVPNPTQPEPLRRGSHFGKRARLGTQCRVAAAIRQDPECVGFSAREISAGHIRWVETVREVGAVKWVVGHGYEDEFGENRRIVQHAFNYIYSASSAAYSCPVSMTSGACHLVRFHLDSVPTDHPFHELYAKLTARENSWVSAQWMTERAGGSDVRNSETVAVYSPLPPKLANLVA